MPIYCFYIVKSAEISAAWGEIEYWIIFTFSGCTALKIDMWKFLHLQIILNQPENCHFRGQETVEIQSMFF